MLKVTQISTMLDVTVRQVHNYIKKKHLKAKKVNGIYLIEESDYDAFIDSYWDKRHEGKGVYSIPTNEQFNILRDFIIDADNKDMDFQTFKTLYGNIKSLIPPIEIFISYKRNKQIIHDRIDLGMTYRSIADKYKLSEISIKKILQKSNEKEGLI